MFGFYEKTTIKQFCYNQKIQIIGGFYCGYKGIIKEKYQYQDSYLVKIKGIKNLVTVDSINIENIYKIPENGYSIDYEFGEDTKTKSTVSIMKGIDC